MKQASATFRKMRQSSHFMCRFTQFDFHLIRILAQIRTHIHTFYFHVPLTFSNPFSRLTVIH